MAPSSRQGFVSIVGAGPGDPALLTRKAAACLRHADLILYDALVDRRVVDFGRRARRFFVGKRAGRHAMTQEAIHALMIRSARRGLRVVRLKGGDPFVFGRGGEEAIALRNAGVRFEVVPGVTSSVAAPAAAGIPVTHRGVASAFLVVTGHDERAFDHTIRSATPDGMTLVVLMAMSHSGPIAERLIQRGWRSDTPVAVIVGAWTDEQQVWKGTLVELGAAQLAAEAPGTIVIGDVAALECKALDAASVETRSARASAG